MYFSNTTATAIWLSLEKQEEKILSDELFELLENFIHPITFLLASFGLVTNVINIRVFLHQGVKNDSTNMGLLALAGFDFSYSLLNTPTFLCYILTHFHQMSEFLVCQTHTKYVMFLAMAFGYCRNWTAVYVSLERTLCVMIPLKVKLLLRPKVTGVIIIFIFIFFFSFEILYMTSTTISWGFDTKLNKTISYFEENSFAKKIISIYFTLANTILNSVAIVAVAINTSIMILKLNELKKWRSKNTHTARMEYPGSGGDGQEMTKHPNPNKAMTSKDVELVKSVTMVTCVFLACLSISHIPATAILILPNLSFTGVNQNILILAHGLCIHFSLVNASTNFCFFIRVSSRYKEAFNSVFPRCARNKKELFDANTSTAFTGYSRNETERP